MELVVKIVVLGIVATIVIDIWATFSNKVLNFPRTNWAMVGRWLGHIPHGQLVHCPISDATEIANENAMGWAFHYFIGILYAIVYGLLVLLVLNDTPSLLFSWGYGLVTILAAWLIMQPCLGLGFCASKAPKPMMVRLQNFTIHTIFGVTLYCGWVWGINT